MKRKGQYTLPNNKFTVYEDEIYFMVCSSYRLIVKVCFASPNGFDINEYEYLKKYRGTGSEGRWTKRPAVINLEYDCNYGTPRFTEKNINSIRKPTMTELFLYTFSCSPVKGIDQYFK